MSSSLPTYHTNSYDFCKQPVVMMSGTTDIVIIRNKNAQMLLLCVADCSLKKKKNLDHIKKE